jgi:hypothetical protein
MQNYRIVGLLIVLFGLGVVLVGKGVEAQDDFLVFLPILRTPLDFENLPCEFQPPNPANPAGVDLVVTLFTLNPIPIGVGQDATVIVKVKNQGQGDLNAGNNFFIDFYDNPVPAPPEPTQIGAVAWGMQSNSLPAGETITLQRTYQFDTRGRHLVWVQIDTDNTVVEAIENNNLYGCLAVTVN